MSIKRAVVGGSGFAELSGFTVFDDDINTPYGDMSSPIMEGKLSNESVYFLPRHGKHHHLPPHKVNYRANLYALHELGVQQVIALAAVGAISQTHIDTTISIPDQIIDYTWGREHTFYAGVSVDKSRIPTKVEHVEFTEPYSQSVREQLITACRKANIKNVDYGVYGVTQGPRLETAAEINKMEKEGVDIVGMTGMPEAALAKELQIDYACLAMTVNAAAGRSKEQLTLEVIKQNIEEQAIKAIKILSYLD